MRLIQERRFGRLDRAVMHERPGTSEGLAMNKIVRNHYPAAKLPKELRGSIAEGSSVKVTIEEEQVRHFSRDELKRQLEAVRGRLERKVSVDEAVARIRELRDEWD